jgi:lipopolysaccharide transport system permease protein
VGPASVHRTDPTRQPGVHTVIRPPARWQLINLRELWQFRDLIYFLVWRDIKVRYKQTALGAAWAVLQPLMLLIVFTVILGRVSGVRSGDLPYPLFACAGLLPWTFFATAISNAAHSLTGSERLVTKIYFPRLAIPLAAVGATVLDFTVALGLLLVLMLWYGVAPGVGGLLLVPVVFAFLMLAGLGVGTLLAALNVRYRDFRYVIPFMLQLWMLATPAVYLPASAGEEGWLGPVLTANPLTGLIETFRAGALGLPIPWEHFGVAASMAVGMFLIGCLYFRTVEDGFADLI